MNLYLIIKSLHLIAAISWLAGLLYLPRIFVYHVENYEKKETTEIFETMEKRLYNYIMKPAMLFSWIFGVTLIYLNGFDVLYSLWIQIKLALVIILSVYNDYLGRCLKGLKNRTNTKTAKFYRYINEIPTLLLILIIFVVIIKPL
tara:strand:- start:60 stop:494 length:435 start_codon:yes stop_codon:yes gene_type:complete